MSIRISSLEAYGHLTEVRHLLQQTNDQRGFTIIRSSSDSLPIITWRGNSSNSGIKSITMTGERISSLGSPVRKAQKPLTTKLPSRPPTYRNVKVYEISTTVSNMINTGLSLDLSNISPKSNNRLEYAEKITGIVNTPTQTPTKKKTDGAEPHSLATSTPRTRNGSVMKGTFDKNHKLQAVSLLGIRAYARCQSHEAQSEASNELMKRTAQDQDCTRSPLSHTPYT